MSHPLIQAIRIKTLPLAAGAMLMGASVSKVEDNFSYIILAFALLTAFLLQILSNLANDYGDFIHGVDNSERTDRALSSGKISSSRMRIYLVINILLVLISGTLLLLEAQKYAEALFWPMFGLGILCILGAVFYTMGKKPYGYYALGDLSVWIFFGPVAVAGSYYLYSGNFSFQTVIPAIFSGGVAAAVLNVNNIRDIESDRAAGKRSLAMLLGDKTARLYHSILLIGCWIIWIWFHFQFSALSGSLQVLTGLLMILHLYGLSKAVQGNRKPFNDQLRNLSLTFLLASLLGFICL